MVRHLARTHRAPWSPMRDKNDMDERETAYLIAVTAAAVWTPRPLVAMLDALGGAIELVAYARNIGNALPPACEMLGVEALKRIAGIDDGAALAALRDVRADGVDFVTSADEKYPQRLRDLCDSPPILYYRGDLSTLHGRTVAVVGSRAATPYGRTMATAISSDCAAFGATVVSGLARGIDACAHRGALHTSARTVAVLGSGIRALYPPYHRKLADEIVEAGGTVLSEFSPSLPARPHQFPMRNRIVAALAQATVVVEAGAKSGALITARLAGELGRPVFAVPGDVGRPSSEGTNALIKDGVALATGISDVAAALHWEPVVVQDRREETVPALLAVLAPGGSSIDEICTACGLDPASVSAQLIMLEMQGLVEQHAGGLYQAVRITTP